MKGYSATEVFSPANLELLRRAERAIEAIPEISGLRCHEVARAVACVLSLNHEDGRYGAVDHSWLTLPVRRGGDRRHILDVYSVGRLPIVQLVDTSFYPQSDIYVAGNPRKDIDYALVERLVVFIRKALP